MAERPLYTLYKNLKAQNYDVPDDYNKFESALTRDGKGGADNRHAIYENLKAQNFDVPSTYERFYSALFEPRSKTSSRAKGGSVPMSAADRARFLAGAQSVLNTARQVKRASGNIRKTVERAKKFNANDGKVTIGFKNPLQNQNVQKNEFNYNSTTGKTGTYTTTDGVEFDNEYDASQYQNQLDKQGQQYINAVNAGEIPSAFDVRDKNGNYDLQENIGKNGTYLTEEGAQKQFDKKLADAYARKKEIEALIAEDNRQHGNPLLSYGASIGASNGRTAEQSDYRNKLATSLSLVTEQIGALEAVKQYPTSSWGEDALKALDNTAFTAKTWDFGLTDFAIMGQMERIKTKMDNNIPLSGSDKMLLKSKLGADAATALEDEKMGNVYRWTKIAGQSLPFMADFFLTGGYGGITKGISRGALKFAAKRGMGKVGAAILKNTGIVAGDVIGSYAMAGTEQALKTGADIMQRHLGNLYQDEKGDYKFGTFDENGNLLHEGGESIGTALYKGMTSAMVENYTEKLFGHNYGIKKGAVNFMEKHGMNASAEFFKNIGKSGWYTNSKKWMEKFGINGFAEEVMEEEIGIPLHALLDGEGKVSDLLDAKQQLDIIGGMAISVGSMYAMGAGSRPVKGIYNRAQYYRFRNKVNVADSDAENLMGDNWADIKDKIDNATNEQMGSVLADILRQRDTMTKEQINAAVNYGVNLMKMRGYNIAKTAEMNAKEITNEPTTPEEQHQADIENAYSEGHDADDADKHDIQIQQEDQMKTLAAALGISEQQLSAMSDEELESLTGQDDKLDQAIYEYQLSSARYQGVVDDAQDKVDLAAHQAEQRVDMYTDQSRGSVRNATIKASGGLEDYGVYIISGNIATHDDGSIDVSNSDGMILYYDPTTNSVEHADALMFAELGEELPAADVKAQAINDAKENAIKKIAGIIDGTVEVGSQFSVTDADGTEHTYEVLADNGDGTAMITIDGNVPTELVKGENVQIPYSFADLQQMKDMEDQKRLEAAKAEREQMEKERAAQQTQETEQSQPSFDFNQILNDNGNVVLVDVLDKDGNTKYPDSRLFLIRDAGSKAKVVELKSDGTIVPHAVNKEDVATISSMSLDEYKQAMPESSIIEDNSGEESDEDSQLANLGLPKGSEIWMSGDGFGRPKENTQSKVVGIDEQGSIILEDKDGKKWSASFDYINNHRELPPLDENTNIVNEENNQSESNAEENTPVPEQTPAMTLEDGTIVPMLEDGNPDFSKLTAEQTAELYDTQFGEDADSIVSGYVSDAKKALDKASNMTVKGKTFVEQKAAKDAKEKAIADAQEAYDSAIAIRDAYNERQLAKVEDTAEGRKELIEKARRKFARLKSAVKDDAEAVSQLYRETIGSLLHRLYDSTGIDVTDTTPLTAEEYVASNLGAHSLNYEGTETSKGVKQETGLSREDFAKTQLLAADGKGTTIDALIHSLWENRPSNLESLDTQDIRNALIGVLNSGFKASEARNFVENIRIAQAENILEEQKRAQENAAYAEQQKAEQEAELKAMSDEKAEQEAKSEAMSDNESDNGLSNESNDLSNETDNEKKNDNINDNINVPEDATDENPLGAQRDESDLPFSAKENGKQQTTAERAADVEKNKVDDMKVVDSIVGEKTRKAFERLAKMMGANIQWQYSDKLGNGWIQETTDADGNVHRTIFITLDSSITEGAQFIFGHEMTHQIKNLNPAAYNELTQLVLDTYGSDAFDKAVDETMQRYSDAGFSGRARDYYAEEVVADAVGEMIRDLNLAHTLAMKMSHPLLAAIHEILQKIKLAFYGTEYNDVTKNIIRSIEQAYVKTANGQVMNTETGEDVSFSLRQKPEPKKKGIGYKVFVLKDGKLYPPMVANPDGAATPVGVWLDADAAPIVGESKTGRPQVKQGGKGTQGGSGKLAYRPGWHLGVVPYAIQFNRKDAEGNKTLFPKNFVFAEVEYAADVDYQEEARQEGMNPSGKYQHSLAGLKHLPTDGYYMYRTNPNPETDPWVITGAMKVNRILTRAEQADLVSKAGREPQQIQEGDIVTDDVVNSINQEIADAPKFSLKVYHGSGADFTEFDFDHMGEGAGSQVFGWGGYVTSSKKIGKDYASIKYDPDKDVEYVGKNKKTFTDLIATLFDGGIRDYNYVKNTLLEISDNDKSNISKKEEYDWFVSTKPEDWFNPNPTTNRNLYEVNIPEDNGSNYLEWEKKPSDEVATKIIEGLYGLDAKTLDDMASKDIVFRTLLYDYIKNADKGQMIPLLVKTHALTRETTYDNGNVEDDMRFVYNRLSRWMGSPKAASQFLSSLGFTGIKYYAGTIWGGAKKGDLNYVIFNEDDAKIVGNTKFSLKSKPVRFEAGKKLSDEEKKEVLSTLKDAYKVNGVPYHIEETAGGKEKRVYEPTADSYVVSDITNRPLRYYITLPDGRVAHPTEVYPNISDNEVKSSATKQGLLDEEVDQIVSAAIGNMKDIADNAKAIEVLTELQNLPHETHDVGYGMNNAQSYNYKTGIFTSDAAQAIDYVVRRMRRKEDVPTEIPAALKKAVADSYGMVDNLIDGMSSTKFSLKDNQGNPLNQDGTLKLDKIKSVDELTDEDFLHPTRNVELPSLPKKIADAIGTEGKPVVIKKNIFERNYMRHKDVTPELSKVIFKSALYNPDLYGQNQKKTRPYNWVLINTKDEKGNNRTVLLEVNPNKDNVEIVHWHFIDERGLKKIKKQADREDGQLLILPSNKEEVGALSDPTVNLTAAKIDNSSETAKENGEKFSLKDEKTMFGMHNISLDKLRKAIKQGGFAAPSMGVIDSKNGIYSGYGEITLIPKAEKIAKRTGKNIGTYAADAWTPIYPPVEKKFGGNGGDVAYDDIESVPKEMQRLTRNAINSFMDGREANGLAYLYLQEKGKAPELVHVEGKYPKELHDEVKGILGKLNGIYNTTDEQKEKLLDLFIREVYDGNKEEFDNDIKKFIKKDEELIKKRPNSNIAKNKQLDVDWMKEHGYDYGALSRFVDGILRDAETSGKVDENATMKAAQQYIQDKGMKEDFDSWKEKLNDRYNVEEVIFAGYKPDGNRKYLPNTVENAVKVMKQDGKNASVGSASFSHFVASILKPMGTLDQIRKKKGNLTGNYEDVEKFQEKWQPVYDELADKMQPDAEPFESYGMDRLEEVATQKNPKKYAKEEYGVDLTDEDINKLNELIEAVKNDKPSIYFETKFMRPYGLDEFEKAIVPNDTPSDVVDALKIAGIDVSSYERGNAEDRQKVTMDAINSSDNIRFSLKSMMAKPEGWKQANKKAIHIAEAIERDPKFSLKNLDGTLIKAGTYFSGGGLVEEGLKGIIDPVVAVEYDEKISGVYRNNFGQHIVTADVRDVDPKELVKQIDGEVEYFHASPVCKNYSQAKSNHAEVELDKETAASTAEFINAVKPKVVTIENVKGYKDSEAMKIITDALDSNGYTWDADVYNAADYGGYTNRERLIVRAVRDGKLPEKPKKMAHKSGWYEAVADIIPTLTEKKNGVAPWMDIRLKADGIDWRNIDKPLYVMGSAYADGKIPHAFADELLPTLRTKSGDVIVMPDGKVYRALGRVLARVSGVSDDYKMPFSENLSHTIIGNGIPTQLTEHVIAPLLQNILRPTTPEDGNTKFSLRYDQFEHDLNQWKKDNNLPKDAKRPTIPQRNAGESAVDFLKRVDEYRKQMALWKTAPTYEQHLLSDDTALGEFNRELQRGSVLKRIAFQDSMLAIRKAQEAIMKEVGVDRLNMAEDAYTAENRSHGKGKNEFEEYNNEFLQPLRKAYHQMKKILGDSYDNVRIYMMAKHGLERDAQMAFKKSLEADYEDVAQRSAAYKAYKGDMNRIINDSDLEFGRVDFTTWRQRDNALRLKYSPSYMDYRYDKNGIAYDYSGLSALFDGSDFEEAAHKLISEIESKYVAETKNLWDATNAATKKILRDGYKAGMMSKDTYQYVRDMYSHYIPLRGWDGTTADQVWDYIGGGKGAFNQTLKKAHGRTSIADDPIAYIENMAESGILLNNKNWVKQHLMLLAQNHPTSLLTLSKAWYVKSVDDNGNEEWIPATPQITSQMDSNQVKAAIDAFEKKMEQMAQTGDATQKRDGLNIAYPQTHSEEREHEVRVMKDGEEYVIYVNGDPQLAQAMNNTRAHRVREIQSGKLDRAAAWLGRKMAAAYTSLSPLFIPSNYFRDLTMTLASTAIREDAKYNYLLRKNLATSWNLGFMLRDYQNGKLRDKVNNGNATPKEQMFYDFMMNGGETGFVSSLDVEDLKKKFKNDLKDLDRWKTNPVKVGHTIMDGIEFLNRAIEDSNRFAVYMTSIQYGRSIDEAVNDAKDVTLNFNRKGTGEYGWQMIRNLYLFINPAVQSLQTLGALVKHHPFKFTAVTASWLASGVLVPIVNAALMSLCDVIASAFGFGGDDDKDKYISMKDKYWQFTKWDRRNNLIMYFPFSHEFVKIPLAQEFRAFYGVGDMIASKMMGGELAEESWSQYAEDLLGQVVDMLPLDPTGYDGNIAVSLMPNAIRPVFELAFNVDFTGKPLFKETEYNKYDPNFTKAYVGTPDWLVRASRMVNSIGNDYPDVQQNSIDAFGDPKYNLNNPAVVDHVLSSYLGGAYTMGSQVLGVLTKSLNDPKEIKVADIPLVSKFVSNPDDRPVTKKQGDEFWNMKENHDRAANTLSKLKKQAKVDGDYSMLERFYGSEEYKQYKQDDVKVKKYEEDKKKERAEESGDEYRPHKLNAEDIYKAHATPKDDFEDLKLKQLYTKLNGFKTSYDLLVDTAPSQSDGYYNTNKAAIDAIDEISLDKQEISELKKGFLDDGKDAYNAEDMKQIRDLRKKILAVLEKANKVVVANQKAKAEK